MVCGKGRSPDSFVYFCFNPSSKSSYVSQRNAEVCGFSVLYKILTLSPLKCQFGDFHGGYSIERDINQPIWFSQSMQRYYNRGKASFIKRNITWQNFKKKSFDQKNKRDIAWRWNLIFNVLRTSVKLSKGLWELLTIRKDLWKPQSQKPSYSRTPMSLLSEKGFENGYDIQYLNG